MIIVRPYLHFEADFPFKKALYFVTHTFLA